MCTRPRLHSPMTWIHETTFRRAARLLLGVGVIAVVWLSLVPRGSEEREFWEHWNYLPHVLAYAALAVCGALGFQQRRPVLTASTGLIVLGCVLELAQVYVPGRSPGLGDVAANVIGIALGLVMARAGEKFAGAV